MTTTKKLPLTPLQKQQQAASTASIAALEFIDKFDEAFIERTVVSRGLLLALVAELPIVLLGPPGTAKSQMIRTFAKCTGGSFFQYLITRFTTPDELFGQFKISALKKDKLERAWKNTSVDAEVIFWDEVFKGSSALLNAMLTALNEAECDIGTGRIKMKYNLIAGASNELPEEGGVLDALWDRWAIRTWVSDIKTDYGFTRLLFEDNIGKCDAVIDWKNIATLRALRDDVDVSHLRQPMALLRAKLKESHIELTGRKWLWVKKAIRASAIISGRLVANKTDIQVLHYMGWSDPTQIPTVKNIVREMLQGNAHNITKLAEDAARSEYRFGEAENYIAHLQSIIGQADKIARDESWCQDSKTNLANLIGKCASAIAENMEYLNQRMDSLEIKDFAQMAENLSEVAFFTGFIKINIENYNAILDNNKAVNRAVEEVRGHIKKNNSLFQSKTNKI